MYVIQNITSGLFLNKDAIDYTTLNGAFQFTALSDAVKTVKHIADKFPLDGPIVVRRAELTLAK